MFFKQPVLGKKLKNGSLFCKLDYLDGACSKNICSLESVANYNYISVIPYKQQIYVFGANYGHTVLLLNNTIKTVKYCQYLYILLLWQTLENHLFSAYLLDSYTVDIF